MTIHVATSRQIGERCIEWAKQQGYELVPMQECDVFVSVMYDKLVHREFMAGRRCYNFHPGVLPEYRGAGAYSWVIINGERETGVTLHEIDEDIDHGAIIDVQRFPVLAEDTAGSLFRQAEATMFRMFQEWLPKLIVGEVKAEPQIEAYAGIYYRKELERAKNLTRVVRAFTFEGKESAYFINSKGEKVYLQYA